LSVWGVVSKGGSTTQLDRLKLLDTDLTFQKVTMSERKQGLFGVSAPEKRNMGRPVLPKDGALRRCRRLRICAKAKPSGGGKTKQKKRGTDLTEKNITMAAQIDTAKR